jgi:hypothetical protein
VKFGPKCAGSVPTVPIGSASVALIMNDLFTKVMTGLVCCESMSRAEWADRAHGAEGGRKDGGEFEDLPDLLR